METYLEELERLGRLRDAGVLTKEEFDAEKARLLQARHAAEEIDAPSLKRRQVYIALASVAAVLLAGGISYLIFKNIGDNPSLGQANSASARASKPAGLAAEQDLSITFADASKCEPGPSLSDLLGKMRDAAASDAGSDLRMIRLAGSPNPVEVQSSVRNFGPQQIRLSSLPVSQTWQGLQLTEVRTTEWEGGDGFQLRFAGSPESLLRVVRAAGFPIKALEKSVTNDGVFEMIEKSQGGATLTCMKSNKSRQPSDMADLSVNEVGD